MSKANRLSGWPGGGARRAEGADGALADDA